MELIIIAVVIFFSGVLVSLIGFGIATILMATLPFFLPLLTVIPLVAAISVVATGIVSYTTKARIRAILLPLIVGSLIGVPAGMFFLDAASGDILKRLLGILLMVYALYALFSKPVVLPRRKIIDGTVGMIAGFFGSSFNINGPLLGMYTSSHPSLSKHGIKDLVATYMFYTGIATIAGHALFGRFTEEVMWYAVFSLPFLFAGLVVGSLLFSRIDDTWVRRAVYAVAFFAGLFFVLY